MISVIVILAESAREWWSTLSGRKAAVSTEVPYEPALALAMDRADSLGVALAHEAAPPARISRVRQYRSRVGLRVARHHRRPRLAALRRGYARTHPTGTPRARRKVLATPGDFAAERLAARYSRPGNRCC